MAMLIGDKSLQFEFVDSMTNPSPVVHNVTYNQATKVLSVPAGIIQHYTLGIDTISSSHVADEYKFWSLPAFTTPTLTDGTKKYYLYAKVSKTAKTGTFYISEQAIAMEGVAGYYHHLLGIPHYVVSQLRGVSAVLSEGRLGPFVPEGALKPFT